MLELRSCESVRCSAVKVLLGLSQQKGGYDIFVFSSCFVFVLVGRGGGESFDKARCCSAWCRHLLLELGCFSLTVQFFLLSFFFFLFFTRCFLCYLSVYGVRMGV
jgi:hypothetical protein